MLRNIPPLLSPDVLKALAELGHGDRLLIADANFPAKTMGKDHLVLRLDGHSATAICAAILTLMPLDQYADKRAFLMDKVKGDLSETPIWEDYAQLLEAEGHPRETIEMVERNAFYEMAKQVPLIIASGERALYGNIILQKGVL